MHRFLRITSRNILKWIVLLVALSRQTEGLKCWVCDGKRTLKECHGQYGRMQECNPGDVCQNDYRLANGKPLLTKGCKQKFACDTEVAMNKDVNQCGRSLYGSNMACRCCCATTGCNSKASGCLPPPPPCIRRNLKNGKVRCSPKQIDFGTRCNYQCNSGFKRVGPKAATCNRSPKKNKKGLWSEEMPVCEKVIIQCLPERTNPKNGIVRCQNTKEFSRFKTYTHEGTRCVYYCDKNYYLSGKKGTVCKANGKWSNKEPECKIGQCEVKAIDKNIVRNCTDGNNFGSRCNFKCKDGFKLIGKVNSECEQVDRTRRGLWSNNFPRCEELKCKKLQNPINGVVRCPDGYKVGSVCTYKCKSGFDLDDTTELSLSSTCQYVNGLRMKVGWSRKPPTCTKIRCKPPHENPVSGVVSCSDKSWLGSVCKFSCNEGHKFINSENKIIKSDCVSDKDGDMFGKWTDVKIDCKPIVCDLKEITVENAEVMCTQGNKMGSECAIKCLEGYVFERTRKQTLTRKCGADQGWAAVESGTVSPLIPKCVIIQCDPPTPLENGSTRCSNDDHIIGTNCQFTCDPEYSRVGKRSTSCQDIKKDGDDKGEWTFPTPKCIRGKCPTPKYDTKRVVQDCEAPEGHAVADFRVGTECKYRCIDEGYYMIDDMTDEVILSSEIVSDCEITRKWSNFPPRCVVKTCVPVLSSLTNGYSPECTDGNKYGSTCVLKCKKKFALTQPIPLTCVADGDNDQHGKWNHEIPKCERSHCDDFGVVKHGTLNCTDGSRIGSVCTLNCIDRYTTKRYEETECLESIEWSRRKNYCCVRCIFNKRIRILGVYDTSAFRSRLDWEYLVDFTESYLAFLVSFGFDVEFGAFKYGKEVDTTSQLKFRKLHDRENVSEVGEGLEFMCDRKCLRNSVAYTGRALRHIDEVVFPEVDTQREHFVIIRTTGRSRDDIVKISQKLRAKNINILVVGIAVKKDAEAKQMQIAGKERNFLLVQKPEDLKDVPAKLFEISRDTGCTKASKNQQCP